ncbi:hypothetical protein [Oxynema aestuarii]|nr:hypothetical protein [Oxynema aestuarii]
MRPKVKINCTPFPVQLIFAALAEVKGRSPVRPFRTNMLELGSRD